MENQFADVWKPNYINFEDNKSIFSKILAIIISGILGIVIATLGVFNHRFLIQELIPVGLVLCLILIIAISLSVKYYSSNLGLVAFVIMYILSIQFYQNYSPLSILFVGGHIDNASYWSDMGAYYFIYGSELLAFSGFLVKNK